MKRSPRYLSAQRGVAGSSRRLLSNSEGDGGGAAREHRQGGLAAEAWRAHPQLARPLLHPLRQWRPGGLQDAARAEQLPRPPQQVHCARLPDHGRGQAAPLHLHHPRPAVDHRHRAQLLRRHREGTVSSVPAPTTHLCFIHMCLLIDIIHNSY